MSRLPVAIAPILALFVCAPAGAAHTGPSAAKLAKDVTAHWNKQWPDQQVAHVSRKSEQCEPGEVEIRDRRGKPAQVKTCLILVDVYVARGYRYTIYRSTEAHYQGSRLVSVQLGEIEKAWKSGGVPAPSPEQSVALLVALAKASLGGDPEVTIVEAGRPRPFQEVYRLTLVVDLSYVQDGKPARREKLLATLESDGGDWKPVPGLSF